MNLKKFIDILYSDDAEKIDDFYTKNGTDIFQNPRLLTALLDLKWSEKKSLMLKGLAGVIVGEVLTRIYEKKRYFNNILPVYIHFSEYMDRDYSFRGVPFEDSENMQRGYIDLLKTLVEEGKLKDFEKDPRYQNFHKSTFKEREELVKKYPHLDADNGYG